MLIRTSSQGRTDESCAPSRWPLRRRPALHLSAIGAKQIIGQMDDAVRANWHGAADAAQLTKNQRDGLWESSILNPAIYGEG